MVRGLGRNVYIMLISWAVWIPISSAIWVYWQIFLEELGTPPSIIALIASASTITLGFARLIGGYVSDRRGRKRIIVIMTYFVGLAYLIMYLAKSWVEILLASLLLNIALLYQPAMSAILADSMAMESRGRGYALVWSIPSIFSLAAPWIAYYFINNYGITEGMRKLFLIMVLASIGIATFRMVFLQETLTINDNVKSGFITDYKKVFVEVIPAMKNLTLYLAITSFGFGLGVMTQLYALRVLNIQYEFWAALSMLNTLVYIILAYPFGWLADRIGRKKLIMASSTISSIAYVLLYLAPKYGSELIVPFIILAATANATSSGATSAIQADYIPKNYRGKGYALLALINSIAVSTGQILGGIIYEFNTRLPFLLASVIFLIGALTAINIKETLKT